MYLVLSLQERVSIRDGLNREGANKGKLSNDNEIDTLISKRLSVENKANLSTNKGKFCNKSEIHTLI